MVEQEFKVLPVVRQQAVTRGVMGRRMSGACINHTNLCLCLCLCVPKGKVSRHFFGKDGLGVWFEAADTQAATPFSEVPTMHATHKRLSQTQAPHQRHVCVCRLLSQVSICVSHDWQVAVHARDWVCDDVKVLCRVQRHTHASSLPKLPVEGQSGKERRRHLLSKG